MNIANVKRGASARMGTVSSASSGRPAEAKSQGALPSQLHRRGDGGESVCTGSILFGIGWKKIVLRQNGLALFREHVIHKFLRQLSLRRFAQPRDRVRRNLIEFISDLERPEFLRRRRCHVRN